jgi:glycogen synthase
MRRGMTREFSWSAAARQYQGLYRALILGSAV